MISRSRRRHPGFDQLSNRAFVVAHVVLPRSERRSAPGAILTAAARPTSSNLVSGALLSMSITHTMATLHFIAGKAGAGKTTLARQLAEDLGAMCICEDEWLVQIADPIHNLADYVKAVRRLRAALAPHVIELLKLDVSVVFDFAGNTRRDRAWVRSLFETAGVEHVLHVLHTDDETCRQRVRERNATQPAGVFFGIVTDEQVVEVNKYFEPPTPEEGFALR